MSRLRKKIPKCHCHEECPQYRTEFPTLVYLSNLKDRNSNQEYFTMSGFACKGFPVAKQTLLLCYFLSHDIGRTALKPAQASGHILGIHLIHFILLSITTLLLWNNALWTAMATICSWHMTAKKRKEKRHVERGWIEERQRGKTLSTKPFVCILVGNNMIPMKI